MIRGVVFDMDGVLVDTESFYSRRRQKYLQSVGRGGDIPDFTGSNEKAIWEALVPEDAALREELMLGYREYRKIHRVPFAELVDPFVRPMFVALKEKGLKTAIASASDTAAIEGLMEAAGIREYVDFYISGEDCSAHKPDPEVYNRALAALGLRPGDAFAVEDSTPGIAAAKNAGMKVYALAPKRGSIDQAAADGILHSLEEVLEKL